MVINMFYLMRNNLTKVVTIILLFFIFSCDSIDKTSFPKIAKGDRAIAFIQSNSEIFASIDKEGGFGDIVFYIFDDSSTYKVTDNNFYEESLTCSPNNNSLLFASSKKYLFTNKENRATYYHGLYFLNFENETYEKFGKKNTKLDAIHRFEGLQWTDNGIYFSSYNNKIYCADSSKKMNIVMEIENDWRIYNQLISSNEKILIFNSIRSDPLTKMGLGIYDIEKSELVWLFNDKRTWKEAGKVQDWSKNDSSFVYTNFGLHSYNVYTQEIEEVSIPGVGSDIIIEEFKYLNENEFVFIYRDINTNITNPTYDNFIGVYNVKNHKFTTLNTPNRQKTFLTVINR